MSDFNTLLTRYAHLLVTHGLNIQPGQVVNLTGEIAHRPLLQKLVEAAYARGAKYVHVDWIDPLHLRTRLLAAKQEELSYVPAFIPHKFNELVAKKGAVLRLVGSELPDAVADLPADKLNTLQLAIRQALHHYYEEGIGRGAVHWLVAGGATPLWGKKVFPNLSEAEAHQKLWEAIFKVCRVDHPDYLERWQQHDQRLHKRADALNALKIKKLHFQGPGTDLQVHLSPQARFTGGTKKGPYGVPFDANLPTEECFTTPDYRYTEGTVCMTRPFLVHGKRVQNLQLTFAKGCIVDFKASEGADIFAAYIKSDAGANRLGEVALVGIDSPIYQSGLIFEETLFDENAACHIAIGFAYRSCLEGGTSMSTAELEAIGCNTSAIHNDMMISSEKVDVTAHTFAGQAVPLICKGEWAKGF